MVNFSERHGYRPDRSRLHQLEEVDDRLRNAIWNFLLERFFLIESKSEIYELVRSVWSEVVGGRSDALPSKDGLWGEVTSEPAVDLLRKWYLIASWYEVYDVLDYVLRKDPVEQNTSDVNAMLSREGSAYRFAGNGIVPITSEEELAAIESAAQLPDPFHGASQHIAQAVALLSNRTAPDFRNAIKESISAVESAVRVAVGDERVDIDKGLEKLALHNQLGQAWKNMFNWTSDEDGVRHGTKGTPQVGLSEARYMVVTCSAFVNYLAVKSTEGNAN